MRNALIARCALRVAPLLCVVVAAHGASVGATPPARDGQRVMSRIERLRDETERLAADLLRLHGREVGVLVSLASVTAARDLASAEAEEATRLSGELDAALVRAGVEATAAADSAQAADENLRRRLLALRRRGPAAGLVAMVTARRPAVALIAMRRLADGAALDRAAATRARRRRAEAIATAGRLSARREAAAAAHEQAAEAADRAVAAMTRQQARLTEVRDQETLHRRALVEMDRATRELQDFVSALRSTEPAGPDPSALRGTLPWPVVGDVVIGFGPRRHPRFGTSVPHTGLFIAVASYTPVAASVSGLVVYADWFQGYGRTVILDHGGGVMTVSAHLAEITVSQGQRIEGGEVLGLVGDSGTLDGPGLYFELREAGMARQPLDWLTPFSIPQ